jgi:excisionase family DNA binding protein
MPEADNILNLKEMAGMLKVPKSWIYQHTRLGQEAIPHFKVGKHLRFQKDKVLKHFGYTETNG